MSDDLEKKTATTKSEEKKDSKSLEKSTAMTIALAEKVFKKNPEKKVQLVKYADEFPPIKAILKTFPESMQSDLTLTGAQLLQLIRFSADRTFGMAQTVPLNCKDADCDFADICLYHKMGIAPEGNPCPEEVDVIFRMVPQLIEDLEVDPENYVELNMVQEYVDAIIQEHRAQKYLALTNDIVPRTVAIDQTTGAPIKQDDFSPSLLNKEKAQRKKERLRKELVATREGRLKHKISNPEDESQRAARMRERMEEAERLDKKAAIEEADWEEVPNDATDAEN